MQVAAPWLREDALRHAPGKQQTYGYVRVHKEGQILKKVADLDALSGVVARGSPGDAHLVWLPGDRHMRTAFEVGELASAVKERGRLNARKSLRKSLPKAFAAIALIVLGVMFWPTDRQSQLLMLLIVIFVLLPLWTGGIQAAWDAWRDLRRIERDPTGWRSTQAQELRFAVWTQNKSSISALGLVALFVPIFGVYFAGDRDAVIEAFALVKERVREGESWRLLSCAFLHGSVMHIMFNAMVGLQLASIARTLVSEARILLVFLLTAVAGSLTSFALTPDTSVGASGGILGWGGMLAGIALVNAEVRATGTLGNMLRWVVLLALLGVAGKGLIDNAAHGGGFLAGALLGAWFARRGIDAYPVGGERLGAAFWTLAAFTAAFAVWIFVSLLLL